MIIVADSSALIALSACNSLLLLDNLFKEVRVTDIVYNEVVTPGKKESEKLKVYLENKVITLDSNELILTDIGLGKGELSSMVLYRKINADRLLIDDKKARSIAKLNNIKIIGSFGILLLAKEKTLIKEIKPLIEEIMTSGIFMSQGLVNEILKLAGE